jgi:hypothetical protein
MSRGSSEVVRRSESSPSYDAHVCTRERPRYRYPSYPISSEQLQLLQADDPHPCRHMRTHVSSRARRGRGIAVRMAWVWCVHGRAHATVGVCKAAGREVPGLRECANARCGEPVHRPDLRRCALRRTHLTAAAVSKPWVLGIGSVGGQDRHQLSWMAQRIL